MAMLICLALTACSGQSTDLYFAVESEGSFYLQAQTRQVKPSPDIYQASLEQLIAGPDQSTLLPTIPASTKVNHVEVDNGLAIADFSAHILTDTSIPHSSTTEELAIYSIVNTLTQFEEIGKVRITIEGKSSGTIDGSSIEDFWGHIGLYDDFSKNEEIILKNEN
ncbi:MAG: GerMN domain-containing protein [Actinomycetota bacterium]|nr:GerMN domain-containing protein [Actinomycetota bacterium]